MPTKTKPPFIQTVRELGSLIGVDHGTAARYCKRADWPFLKRGPWPRSDIPRMMRWRADFLKQQVTDEPTGALAALKQDEIRARIRKLTLQADAEERRNAIADGTLVDRAEYRSEWMARVVAAKNKLIGMPAIMAPSLVGQDAGEIEHALRDRIESIIREIQAMPHHPTDHAARD